MSGCSCGHPTGHRSCRHPVIVMVAVVSLVRIILCELDCIPETPVVGQLIL